MNDVSIINIRQIPSNRWNKANFVFSSYNLYILDLYEQFMQRNYSIYETHT